MLKNTQDLQAHDLHQVKGIRWIVGLFFSQDSLPNGGRFSKFPNWFSQAGFEAGSVLQAGHVSTLLSYFPLGQKGLGAVREKNRPNLHPNLAPNTHRTGFPNLHPNLAPNTHRTGFNAPENTES